MQLLFLFHCYQTIKVERKSEQTNIFFWLKTSKINLSYFTTSIEVGLYTIYSKNFCPCVKFFNKQSSLLNIVSSTLCCFGRLLIKHGGSGPGRAGSATNRRVVGRGRWQIFSFKLLLKKN